MSFATKPDRFSSCAIIPGRVSDPDGFVTEHREIEGLMGPVKLYFSVAGLRQLASRYEQVGLADRIELDSAREANMQLAAALREVTAERDELKTKVDIYVRGHEQMLGRKPPKGAGRPLGRKDS